MTTIAERLRAAGDIVWVEHIEQLKADEARMTETVMVLDRKLKEARALIADMKAALEPFAVRAAVYDPPNGDDGDLDWFNGGRVITVGDFRRARDLYERTTP